MVPPLRARLPAASVLTDATLTAPPKVVVPLLLTVSAWAPLTVPFRATWPPLVASVVSVPSVSAPLKTWFPVLRTGPFSVVLSFSVTWFSAVVAPMGPATVWPWRVSAWPPAVLPSTPASVTVVPVSVVSLPSTTVSP